MTPPVTAQAIPQPNFLADNVSADALGLHSMAQLNLQPPMRGVSAVPANSISLNDPEDPFGFHDGPRHNLAPQRLAEEYGVNIMIPPEVQLPANWDAPLQNPIPAVPPMPIPPRRGRRMALHRPMHDISGGQSDPALNGLHRGHIAHREQAANHHAEVQRQQLAEQMHIEREQLRDLCCHAEKTAEFQQQQQDEEQRRRGAETARYLAWARERQQEAQRAEEEEERLNLEAHHREVNHMRHQEELEAHTSRGAGSRNHHAHQQQNEEQRRREAESARYLAGARERQREAQHDEEEEERLNLEAHQREVNYMCRQEELEAHTSGASGSSRNFQQHLDAAAAAEYERNCLHENRLRREEEAESKN